MSRRLRDVASRASTSWSKQDPDSRNSFLLIAGISGLVVIALAVIGYGYYQDRIAGRNDPVLRVGSHEFTYSELERRVKTDVTGASNLTNEQLANVISRNLADLEREELLRQIARDKGITVSSDELDAQMRDDLTVSKDAARDIFASRLRRELLTSGMSLAEYKKIASTRVIEAKLRDAFAAPIPAEAEQIDPRLIQLPNEAEAIAAKLRLDRGEAVASVAATASVHASRSKAGEVGWVARGALPSKLEDVAFTMAIGTVSDVVETDEGFFIIEVRAREVRAVTEEGRELIVEHALATTLLETRERVGAEILLTAGQIERLARSAQTVVAQGG